MSADFPSDPIGVLDPWAEDAPVLAGLASVSVQGRVALGPGPAPASSGRQPLGRRPGARWPPTRRPRPGRCHAATAASTCMPDRGCPAIGGTGWNGFCRYVLQPPVAQERLELTAAGRVGLPSDVCGRTGPRPPSSGRSICWRGWRLRRCARRTHLILVTGCSRSGPVVWGACGAIDLRPASARTLRSVRPDPGASRTSRPAHHRSASGRRRAWPSPSPVKAACRRALRQDRPPRCRWP